MIDKLNIVKQRFDEVSDLIIQPDIISDQKRYVQLTKEYSDLKALVGKRDQYLEFTNNISEAQELIADGSDAEMLEMAKMQLEEAKAGLPILEEEIKLMLIPKDPEDAKDVVMEIRAGTGGDEASIFAGDLFRMYTKYCESRGWKTNVIDLSEGTSGGYKEIQFEVSGADVYGTLKFEAGVHRVRAEGSLLHLTDWEWSFQLKPRRVTIDAPGWNVSGVRPDGTPEAQVFFSRKLESGAGEASYDRPDVQTAVGLERQIELGLVWQVRTTALLVCWSSPLPTGSRLSAVAMFASGTSPPPTDAASQAASTIRPPSL